MNKINTTTLIINKLKDYYNFKTDTQFADFLGIAPTTLSSWKSRDSLDYKLIYSKCVEVNAGWLLTGKGEMLKSDDLLKKQPTIQLNEPSPEYDDTRNIPIIDIESAAGAGAINSDTIDVLGSIKVPRNTLSQQKAIYYAIKNKGDSMFPTIHDKDILIVRQLDKSEWQDLRDEYVYIVVDREGNTYTKRIKDRLSRGFIVCTSDNLDKANYPNFTLEDNELSYFFYVELKISAHLPNINSSYFHRLKELEDRFDEFEREVKLLKQ